MPYSLRQKVGAIVLDAPSYLAKLLATKLGMSNAWLLVRNRKQRVITSRFPFGVHCQWQWTSDLYLPKIFPLFSKLLLKQALSSASFSFASAPQDKTGLVEAAADVTFIIGHRGRPRLGLLLKTLESIAAQKGCSIECIVVELDHQPKIKDALPSWVKYIHHKTNTENQAYNRALAFNVGAVAANSPCVIFHDNDLLVSNSYAFETLRLVRKGFDFVNLKRFIFYLSEASSHTLRLTNSVDHTLEVESIMQNAEGGGSIGCSLKAFYAIGGFDQRFIGWGGEDNEFWERAQTLNIWPYSNQCLIHQWHGAQVEKLDLDQAPTLKLYRELNEQSPSARIAWLKENQALEQEEGPCAV